MSIVDILSSLDALAKAINKKNQQVDQLQQQLLEKLANLNQYLNNISDYNLDPDTLIDRLQDKICCNNCNCTIWDNENLDFLLIPKSKLKKIDKFSQNTMTSSSSSNIIENSSPNTNSSSNTIENSSSNTIKNSSSLNTIANSLSSITIASSSSSSVSTNARLSSSPVSTNARSSSSLEQFSSNSSYHSKPDIASRPKHDKSRISCSYCKELGHKRAKCPVKLATPKK